MLTLLLRLVVLGLLYPVVLVSEARTRHRGRRRRRPHRAPLPAMPPVLRVLQGGRR